MPVAKVVHVSDSKKSVILQVRTVKGDFEFIEGGFVMLAPGKVKNIGDEINIPNFIIEQREMKDGRKMPWMKFI